METEKFRAAKVELLKVAADVDRAEDFNSLYQTTVESLFTEMINTPDSGLQAQARAQILTFRKIAGAQVRFLANAKNAAMADELADLDEDEFKKA